MSAKRKHLFVTGAFLFYLMLSFSFRDSDCVNLHLFLAGMMFTAPVEKFLPFRGFVSTRLNVPNPRLENFPPFLTSSAMAAHIASKALFMAALLTFGPAASAMISITCSCVI